MYIRTNIFVFSYTCYSPVRTHQFFVVVSYMRLSPVHAHQSFYFFFFQLHVKALYIRTNLFCLQLRAYLHRYQKLFEETKQSLVENRESILETLVNIHEDLLQVTDHAGDETADIQSEIR